MVVEIKLNDFLNKLSTFILVDPASHPSTAWKQKPHFPVQFGGLIVVQKLLQFVRYGHIVLTTRKKVGLIHGWQCKATVQW
jgi:hypothetical protein